MKKNRTPKYCVVFHVKREYRREGRKDAYIISSNSLENLLKLVDRRVKRHKRNPWEFFQILTHTQFSPYKEAETLLFIRLNN